MTCRSDGSRGYDISGACVPNNCEWPGGWPADLPDGYEVIDRYCGGDTWSYSGSQLAVSMDQLELSCDAEAVGIRSAFGTRIVPWSTVIEWRVNITKWKNDNTSDVGELWFGVVEVKRDVKLAWASPCSMRALRPWLLLSIEGSRSTM